MLKFESIKLLGHENSQKMQSLMLNLGDNSIPIENKLKEIYFHQGQQEENFQIKQYKPFNCRSKFMANPFTDTN